LAWFLPCQKSIAQNNKGAILSDNYSQVVTGVESCQAYADKIGPAAGLENE